MKVVWLDSAVNDLDRLKEFLKKHSNQSAHNAATKIIEATKQLVDYPSIGKPLENLPEYRDLGIRYGAGGYVLRYRIYEDIVYFVHLRHYRESDFKQ